MMKKILMTGLVAVLASGALAGALAGDIVQWQDNSLSLLRGGNFEVNPETQTTVTFEHVSGWNFGDMFFFLDVVDFDGDMDYYGENSTYYGEFAPRLSASKLTGKDLSIGFLKDVLLATTFEFGEDDIKNYLVGPGFDLAIPGFDFFQLNVYRRYNESGADSFQITPVWKMSQAIGKTTLVFDGFIDWEMGNDRDNLHICPQLKLDIGSLIGMDAGKLFGGVEYDYWENKYNLDFADQSAISALVKYHF
jgi:nucleoside-specific outer membrane channel protein Tsx